jgi:hypothetical protein
VCNESFGEHAPKTCMPTYGGAGVHVPVKFLINHSVFSEGTSVHIDKESSIILLCVWIRI